MTLFTKPSSFNKSLQYIYLEARGQSRCTDYYDVICRLIVYALDERIVCYQLLVLKLQKLEIIDKRE